MLFPGNIYWQNTTSSSLELFLSHSQQQGMCLPTLALLYVRLRSCLTRGVWRSRFIVQLPPERLNLDVRICSSYHIHR